MPALIPQILEGSTTTCPRCFNEVPRSWMRASDNVEGEFCTLCVEYGKIGKGFVNDARDKDYIEEVFLRAFRAYLNNDAYLKYDARHTSPPRMGFVYLWSDGVWVNKSDAVVDKFSGINLLARNAVQHYKGGWIPEYNALRLYTNEFAHEIHDLTVRLSEHSKYAFQTAIWGRGADEGYPIKMPDGTRLVVLNSEGPEVVENYVALKAEAEKKILAEVQKLEEAAERQNNHRVLRGVHAPQFVVRDLPAPEAGWQVERQAEVHGEPHVINVGEFQRNFQAMLDEVFPRARPLGNVVPAAVDWPQAVVPAAVNWPQAVAAPVVRQAPVLEAQPPEARPRPYFRRERF